MTDKQIIIDVTQCPYYKEDKTCTYLPHNSKCEGDCNWTTYKELEEKLLRKEQECEELKEDLIEAKAHGDYLNNLALSETLNLVSEQFDQLKAENEELATINARLLGRLEVDETDASLVFNLDKELRQKEKEFYTAIQKVVKLKQTLAEIKEITEKAQWDYRMPKEVWDLILQKINEVENV